ncbi:hypothetical protein EMEDMD4_370171 [Sinorhizobium medicae]|uniref:Uncharacterized protein n=1 Tax=Sinorhizobium medicae TaxID=110321 RepID=A0A508WXX7_9HYPH|nr:hypothetical protein EMEDMD4_370171 [Sinorhizobium medicae]
MPFRSIYVQAVRSGGRRCSKKGCSPRARLRSHLDSKTERWPGKLLPGHRRASGRASVHLMPHHSLMPQPFVAAQLRGRAGPPLAVGTKSRCVTTAN